jgi:hypothetical protein
LHITVFDAVVDHLDEVTRTFFTDPIAARRSVFDLGGNSLDKRNAIRFSINIEITLYEE